MIPIPLVYYLGATLAGVLLAVLVGRGGRVDVFTVQGFCRRQGVPLTPATVPVVVDALVARRTWARAGLGAGIALWVAWSLRRGYLGVNFTELFIGWFLGAVAGEWFTSGPAPRTARSGALLCRRTVSSFLSRDAQMQVLLMLVGILVAAGGAATRLPGAGPLAWRQWGGTLAEVLVGVVVLVLVVRRIVGRRMADTSPDVQRAEEALRGHSLSVVAGSAIALGILPLCTFVAIWRAPTPGLPWAAGPLMTAVIVLFTLHGWMLARSRAPRPAARGDGATGVATR